VSRLVTATVTPAFIAAGVPGSVDERHPVAMAVRAALGLGPPRPGVWIGVAEDWFSITGGSSFYESHDLDSPPGWIKAYDRREPVPPFTFTFTTRWGEPEMSAGRGRI
jgi:hypothetical protein